MSHLLHLDILFPLNMRCTYANNAEEHNNDNSDDKDNSDGHRLSSIKYWPGIRLGALRLSVVPSLTAYENCLGVEETKLCWGPTP